MSLRRFIAKLLHEVGEANGSMESKEEAEAMLKRMKPERTPTGILDIRSLILCPCGGIIPVQTCPPEFSDKEVAELRKRIQNEHPDALLVDATPENWEDKRSGHNVCVMNRAHTVQDCAKCGKRFVVAWEMDCASINPAMKIPWGDPEVPESPASGLSFSPKSVDDETVH